MKKLLSFILAIIATLSVSAQSLTPQTGITI